MKIGPAMGAFSGVTIYPLPDSQLFDKEGCVSGQHRAITRGLCLIMLTLLEIVQTRAASRSSPLSPNPNLESTHRLMKRLIRNRPSYRLYTSPLLGSCQGLIPPTPLLRGQPSTVWEEPP